MCDIIFTEDPDIINLHCGLYAFPVDKNGNFNCVLECGLFGNIEHISWLRPKLKLTSLSHLVGAIVPNGDDLDDAILCALAQSENMSLCNPTQLQGLNSLLTGRTILHNTFGQMIYQRFVRESPTDLPRDIFLGVTTIGTKEAQQYLRDIQTYLADWQGNAWILNFPF